MCQPGRAEILERIQRILRELPTPDELKAFDNGERNFAVECLAAKIANQIHIAQFALETAENLIVWAAIRAEAIGDER